MVGGEGLFQTRYYDTAKVFWLRSDFRRAHPERLERNNNTSDLYILGKK